jgi:hypothetical protein
MNTPHDIIGYKQSIFGISDKGNVVPIAKLENGQIEEISLHDYPNTNTIFISRNYEEIDQKVKDDELFLIRANLSFDFEENIDNPHKSKFWSDNTNLRSLDQNLLIPIIKSEILPEKETGIWRNINPTEVPNKPFFILFEDNIFGPFITKTKINNVEVTPYFNTILGIPQNTISTIKLELLEKNNFILEANINNKKKIFLKNINSIAYITSKKDNHIDYISNENLITFFTKNGFGKNLGNLGKVEANKLKSLIDSFYKEKSFNNTIQNNERLTRVKSILTEFIEANNENNNIVNNFLKTSDGHKYLENYFSKNKDEITKILEEKISKEHDLIYQKHATNLNDRKSRLDKQFEHEKDLYNKQINELKIQLDSLKNESKNAAEAKVDENINKKRLELQELEENYNKILNEKLNAENLVEAEIRLKIIEKEKNKIIKDLDEEIKNRNITILEQKQILKDENISKAIVQTKLIQNIFEEANKAEVSLEINEKIHTPNCIEEKYYPFYNGDDKRTDFIKTIQSNVNNNKSKKLGFDDTANIIITTLQSYLTIFSGPPGVGKTSTATNFAKALGLHNPEYRINSNFLNISVGRGWTTTQDFVGYYNSLRDSFQPSKTGLYQFLSHKHNDFLKLVLLDEANLSSIEHYWSDFLSICDDFENNKFLDLGILNSTDRFLFLPPSLRFIATINNDSTVEPLSDRLLDRAAIISLNNDQIAEDYFTSPTVYGSVPYSLLKECFMVSENPIDNDSIESEMNNLDSLDIINAIIHELKSENIKGGQIHISERKINAIKNYLKIAKEINFENRQSPIDFALSQHILPKIKGHGTALENRLQKILKITNDNDLKLSQKLLTNILNNGNSFTDSFDFFC